MDSIAGTPKTQARLTYDEIEAVLATERTFESWPTKSADAFAILTEMAVAFYRKMPYYVYLQTSHWRTFRNLIVEKLGSVCEECGVDCHDKGIPIEVHHLHYKSIGRELPADVARLCPSCHARHHGYA